MAYKTAYFLKKYKEKLNLQTDLALAEHLSVSRQYISNVKLERSMLSMKTAELIANELDIDVTAILICKHVKRAKTEKLRDAWAIIQEELMEEFSL